MPVRRLRGDVDSMNHAGEQSDEPYANDTTFQNQNLPQWLPDSHDGHQNGDDGSHGGNNEQAAQAKLEFEFESALHCKRFGDDKNDGAKKHRQNTDGCEHGYTVHESARLFELLQNEPREIGENDETLGVISMNTLSAWKFFLNFRGKTGANT